MLLILVILLFIPQQLTNPKLHSALIIWNVGQGQWVTLKTTSTCYHFDLGGEFFPKRTIQRHCKDLNNFALFSHWDWDHIGLSNKARRALPNLCILTRPAGPGSAKKRAFFKNIPNCPKIHTAPSLAEEIYAGSASTKEANEASRVFLIAGFFLNPGDSSKEREREWRTQLEKPKSITHLIAGHHGSATSNGEELLRSIPELKQVVVSARYKRYKHPHWKIEARFQEFGTSLVRTEDWGNIIVPLREF